MSRFIIEGGTRLKGKVCVSGSKNASVAAIPAALLADQPSVLENLPDIGDTRVFAEILQELGANVEWIDKHTVKISPNGCSSFKAPYELVKRLRASYYLIGVLLARFGKAEVALPGGCDIGLRPIDQHLKGLRSLGASITMEHGVVRAVARNLVGASIYLDVVSVGATINTMLAACLAEGTSVIENAAKEPHIVDLANCLNAMGARIQGAGTDVIKIRGVKSLQGASHAIIPDDIEAATYMMATAATSGDVIIENIIPKHLESIGSKLKETGVQLEANGESIRVIGPDKPKAANVKTLPYPGFPTDCQQPFVALMSMASGVSVVQETVYDNRFTYANELIRMGANIKVDGRTAIVEGVPKLFGCPVKASDLRGGAALVVAALAAEGVTQVEDVEHIDRGYERMENKLQLLGSRITRSFD